MLQTKMLSTVLNRRFHTSRVVRGGWQYAITGYGVPLPISAHDNIKPHVDIIKSSEFHSNKQCVDDWNITKNTVISTSKPIVIITDDCHTKSLSLMVFLRPICIHVTSAMLNNNIYGPFVDLQTMYLRTIDLFHNSHVHDQPDRNNTLCHLLWSTSINPDAHFITKTKTKDTDNSNHISGLSDNPYHDWLVSLDTKYKTKRDCFGLYALGIN